MVVEAPTRPKGKVTIWARRGGMRKYGDRKVSFGMVVSAKDSPNDAKLLDMGYLREWDITDVASHCVRCGEWFIDTPAITQHNEWCAAEVVEIAQPVALPDVPNWDEEEDN